MVSAFVEGLEFLFSAWDEFAILPAHLVVPRANEWAVTRCLRYTRLPAQRTARMRRARKLKYRWYR
ncbi:hypothetical protein WK77_06150 [Burkholderia ubonensis]|nr:hypothetical protein WK77_06150 [Burkholderia ubonensis]